MAKKANQIVVTDLGNGYNKLTKQGGLTDTRNGRHYSEVVCKPSENGYFI